MKLLLSLLAAATLTLAADATGTWTGSFTINSGKDSGETRPAHLILKQDRTKLTGTAGSDADKQVPIANGKVEDGVLTFEIGNGERVTTFKMKQDGDEMKGKMIRGEHTADFEAKRAKP